MTFARSSNTLTVRIHTVIFGVAPGMGINSLMNCGLPGLVEIGYYGLGKEADRQEPEIASVIGGFRTVPVETKSTVTGSIFSGNAAPDAGTVTIPGGDQVETGGGARLSDAKIFLIIDQFGTEEEETSRFAVDIDFAVFEVGDNMCSHFSL